MKNIKVLGIATSRNTRGGIPDIAVDGKNCLQFNSGDVEKSFHIPCHFWLRSFLKRLTSLISALISSRVNSGVMPFSALALAVLHMFSNAALALAVSLSSLFFFTICFIIYVCFDYY